MLVTAPPRVVAHVWPAEAALWRPDLTVVTATGTPAQRAKALESGADIIAISNSSSLADALPYASDFRTFVIDELSAFKSRATNRWKVGREISRSVEHIWGLTGTPAPNGLLDLWAQIYLLDEGERLERNITRYRRRYFYPGKQLPNGVITEWHLHEGSDTKIHERLEDICLSMGSEGRVDLPPVTRNVVRVAMPAKAKRIYERMKEDLVADLEMLGDDERTYTAANAAVLSGRLSQISAGFMYDDPDDRGPTGTASADEIHREKANAVREIVEGTGSPVLVFHRFKAEVDMLRAAMPDLVHTADERGVFDAWDRGEIPVLVAHPASVGHGLNLQHGGHTIVWSTLPWSLEHWEQGNKRVNRQGQKNPVVIHVLQAIGTIDASILARLEDKRSVQEALLEHLKRD